MREIAYQRSLFGFWIFSVCFTTNDFTRANSFWKPFTKLFGPYSKSTTKQKAKTMNRTSQNSPRSNPMAGRVTLSKARVNTSASVFDKQDACRPRQTGSPSSLNRRPKLPRAKRSHYRCVLNLLANHRAMRLMRSQNFSNQRSPIASGSSCVLCGVKLILRGANRGLYRRSQRRVGSGVAKRGRL